MATPNVLTFDTEGRAVDFEVWVDDLQLFLQCDRADGLSLFDLTSGVSPALPATADSTVRSYRSALRLSLAGSTAPARARGARALRGPVGTVDVVVEAVEGVGVVVGVVVGVEVSVAAVEAEEAAVVAEGAEAAAVAEATEVAEAEEVAVELVAALHRGVASVVVLASSSSTVVRICPLSSFVSGTLRVSGVGVLVPAPTSFVQATALVSSAGARTPPSATSAA
ncbi:unnamed protein product [Closterium sp. NIES-65]|nr:unnamed protein product [Closterium sp. NIES-65]